AKASAAKAARSREPSGPTMSSPNSATSIASPGVPGSTTSRAIASASTITAPDSSSTAVTVDFPAPIPPVRPTISMSRSLGDSPAPHPDRRGPGLVSAPAGAVAGRASGDPGDLVGGVRERRLRADREGVEVDGDETGVRRVTDVRGAVLDVQRGAGLLPVGRLGPGLHHVERPREFPGARIDHVQCAVGAQHERLPVGAPAE